MNDHFATNALHGSVYDLEDLLAITLANENLVAFLRNWETVLSGIQKAPDDTFLEPLFHCQVKKCKALQHDINIYERALDGPDKTYKFLCDAASNHINRKRLERNRERIATQTAGQPTVPAPNRVPKGFLHLIRTEWLLQQMGESCKYKHETPQQRGRSNTPNGGRGRSPGGRARSGSQPSKQECKFYKVGKCDRGDKCRFVHKGQPSVPAPSDAESGGSSRGRKGDKHKKKKKKERKKSKSSSRSSRSSRSSKSSKGSKGSKGSGKGKKPSIPAAVCLLGAMLAGSASSGDGYAFREDMLSPADHCTPLAYPALSAVRLNDVPGYLSVPVNQTDGVMPCKM